jgi:hypothetical protein
MAKRSSLTVDGPAALVVAGLEVVMTAPAGVVDVSVALDGAALGVVVHAVHAALSTATARSTSPAR